MIRLFGILALVLATPAAAEPQRVLSIGGAVTEIVYALGQQDRLVGRDTTSNWPPEAKALPDVGYMRALSPEGVLSLAPDLILAESGAGPAEAMEAITAASVPVVTVPDVLSPEGVADKIRTVAVALGQRDRGETLAGTVLAEIEAVAARTSAEPQKRRAVFLLSTTGGRLMAAGEGSSAEVMLQLAGAENALSGFQGYKQVSDEAMIAAAPDVVVMMERDQTPSAADIFALPALAASPAASGRQLVTLDGLFLLGFGPRTGEAVRALHDALYPAGG
ncbi:ABC transporter substrate-binding protein (plasmid) [Cereibacter azotoformans]|uniref:heme/hemin ABC transporter substrate-binding protein n=1 Tax=Cereibacter azotoformans TaxID=43057 RepID=UPI001EEC3FE5|nr:ABC transporter substrate-binding protein [Cereibacter azotoformans]ULB12430.1 ABC transporter substrate-binding protein [Cereibacter azotoformans]